MEALDYLDSLIDAISRGDRVIVCDSRKHYQYLLYRSNMSPYSRLRVFYRRRIGLSHLSGYWHPLNPGWRTGDYYSQRRPPFPGEVIGGELQSEAAIILGLIFSGRRDTEHFLADLKCGRFFSDYKESTSNRM